MYESLGNHGKSLNNCSVAADFAKKMKWGPLKGLDICGGFGVSVGGELMLVKNSDVVSFLLETLQGNFDFMQIPMGTNLQGFSKNLSRMTPYKITFLRNNVCDLRGIEN